MYYQAKPKTFFLSSNIKENNYSEDLIFFHRSRDALYFYLKHLSIDEPNKRKIWIPAFICNSVTSMIEKTNFDTQFYEIDKNLNPILENINFSQNDVIILVNFFGMSTTLEVNQKNLSELGVKILIDNAHKLPKTLNTNQKNCDAIVYGLWKNMPTINGSILISDLNQNIKNNNKLVRRSKFINRLKFFIDESAAKLNINILFIKDILKKNNTFIHEDYHLSKYILDIKAINKIKKYDFDKANERRIINFSIFFNLIRDYKNILIPFSSTSPSSSPMAFPILLDKPRELRIKLRNAGIECYNWPGLELPKNINWENYPISKNWIDKLLLIPINQDLSEKDLFIISKKLKQALEIVYEINK